MMDFWRRLMTDRPDPLPRDEARLALAVLLVRIARADGDYADVEIARIERVLAGRFDLAPEAVTPLLREAETLEQEAPDTVRFTRALKTAVPLDDRIGLVEALWSVALADGGRDAAEDRMMRMVVSLLGVTDPESGLARQKVLRRMHAL